jgi:SAM-dependent methyltransferase
MALVPSRRHYFAVFLLSLSLLMLEIAVSRVLSVALFSHYAFVAISLAMFGLGLSGLVVYLFPSHFTADKLDEQVIAYSWRFGLFAAVSLLVFLRIHVVQELSWQGFLTLGSAYAVLAVPFFFGGVCISLLMTHFSSHIGRIYFADLLGASIGCLGVVVAMQMTSAPHVVLVVAALVSAATLLVAINMDARRVRAPAIACAIVAVFVVLAVSTNAFTMRYIKNQNDYYSDYAAWNAFSRVSAFPSDRNATEIVPLKRPPGAYENAPKTMILDIDGAAWTPMMNFNGDLGSIQFLRESVLYVAHHLKPAANVLIIGTGGGRDILAALAFGQKSVLGIEINPLMRHLVEDHYGDYSGHPYTHPGVEVIIDEGRSRLSHLDRTFDVLQLSLIDTFSLNAAGGFVFSENYLYTTEALQEYFRHLSPDGILSLTRYYVPSYPLEIQRLAGMARAAWTAEGVENVADHVLVLRQNMSATMLVKRSPFTPAELQLVDRVAQENNMAILYRPGMREGGDANVATILTTPNLQQYFDGHEFILNPPTDDRPFFFNFLRTRLHNVPVDPFKFLQLWDDALALMYLLIAVVTTIAVFFLVGPLLFLGRTAGPAVRPSVAVPLLLYFACLGYGFMMIEIPLLQRFVLFLGYPVYALAVVLFALLLFSGMGSLLSTRFTARATTSLVGVLLGVITLSVTYSWVVPSVIMALLAIPIWLKIVTTVILLAPIGLLLGMAYPLGITILRGYGEGLVPWAWGLNGAMSVVASVLATFVGSRVGFTAALLTGVGAYAVALLSMAVATGLQPQSVEAVRVPSAGWQLRKAAGAK